MSELIGGRYRIIEKIGEGGMGEVYAAQDVRLRREVALKRLHAYGANETQLQTFKSRFEREAISMAQFVHPYIVPVYDFGDDEEGVYLVMGYMSGGSLKDRIGQPMSAQESTALLLPIAEALSYVHSHGLIHRDVKPHNILFNERGTPMLSDFGIVKLIGGDSVNLTTTGAGVGTPAYMAPEQMTTHIDHRADQYALGIILYEMLTGKLPFKGETPMMTLFMHRTEPLPDPHLFVPTLPDAICGVMKTALEKEPEDRYADMREFSEALKTAAAESENHSISAFFVSDDEVEKSDAIALVQTMVGAPSVFDGSRPVNLENEAHHQQDPLPVQTVALKTQSQKEKKNRRKIPVWVPIAAGILTTLCMLMIILNVLSGGGEARQATRTAAAALEKEATRAAMLAAKPETEPVDHNADENNPVQQSGQLSFSGANAMEKLTQQFIGPFTTKYPNFEINLQGGGSSLGILAVGRDNVNFGMTRRVLEAADWERFPRLNPHTVALDALLVITNPAAGVENCSIEDLKRILNGKANNWADFGGPDLPIQFYLPPLDPDITLLIEAYLAGEAGLQERTTTLDSQQAVVEMVANAPNAVGLIFYGTPFQDVAVLAVNDVFPDEGKIISHEYPLVIEMVYITNNEPSEEEFKFLEFVRSDQGERIIRDSGYIPIR